MVLINTNERKEDNSMIKLIASDMDGTLLDGNGKLNEEFFHVFKKLKKNNIIFAAASGRQYFNLAENFKPVKDDMLFICENGTYVLHKDKELYSNVLDKSYVDALIEHGRTIEGCELVLCGKKSAYIEKSYEKFITEVEKYYFKYTIVDDLTTVDDDILKVTLCDFLGAKENSNNIISPTWGAKLHVAVSGQIWLDITNKGANKGVALEHVQEKLNVSYGETMVFGDYYNDLEMLKKAHYSFAMENAPEEVKESSNFVAKSNINNGVLEEIKNRIL